MSGLLAPNSPALAQLSHAETFAVMMVMVSLRLLPVGMLSASPLLGWRFPSWAFPFAFSPGLVFWFVLGGGDASVVAWELACLGVNQELKKEELGELVGPSPGNPSVDSKSSVC